MNDGESSTSKVGRGIPRSLQGWKTIWTAVGILWCVSVRAGEISRHELEEALRKNPDVLIEAIKANKKVIFEIINRTGVEEQARVQKEADEAQQKALEDSIKNPVMPAVDDKTRIRGVHDAKYTLVEYADFECPFCAAGHQTVEQLRKEYGRDLRFIFKHAPLPIHPQAMSAARWLEAIAMQSEEKAWEFHDLLFENQNKLGEEFFRKTANELGVDLKRCEKDLESDVVNNRIAADVTEAKKYGFDGIPAFVLNGVPVSGAYPQTFFEDIIKKLNSSHPN